MTQEGFKRKLTAILLLRSQQDEANRHNLKVFTLIQED